MTIELYTELRNEVEPKMNAYSEALLAFPRLANGLTPDHVRATSEYIKAKQLADLFFDKFRTLNKAAGAKMVKQYHKNKNGGPTYSFQAK